MNLDRAQPGTQAKGNLVCRFSNGSERYTIIRAMLGDRTGRHSRWKRLGVAVPWKGRAFPGGDKGAGGESETHHSAGGRAARTRGVNRRYATRTAARC